MAPFFISPPLSVPDHHRDYRIILRATLFLKWRQSGVISKTSRCLTTPEKLDNHTNCYDIHRTKRRSTFNQYRQTLQELIPFWRTYFWKQERFWGPFTLSFQSALKVDGRILHSKCSFQDRSFFILVSFEFRGQFIFTWKSITRSKILHFFS